MQASQKYGCDTAYLKAIEIRSQELRQEKPNKCVLFACEVAIRNLAPRIRKGFLFYTQERDE